MKVAAFNAKNLGNQKVSDPFVSDNLIKIISQYSIMMMLEVVDKRGSAMKKLLEKLNETADHQYEMVISDSLGRNTYKEQFVCFYREEEVTKKAQYQYEDNQVGDEDVFAREPLILHFNCPQTAVEDLVLIPVHTKPEDSKKELDELADVVDVVREKWRTSKIMILGDFNAAGRYLSKKKKDSLRIASPPFHWLIDDDVDTTTSNLNEHTYDRIVVYGEEMLEFVVTNSAKSFNFQREFSLTDKEALSISDHYPVEVELKSAPKKAGATRKPAEQKRKKAAATKSPTKKRR